VTLYTRSQTSWSSSDLIRRCERGRLATLAYVPSTARIWLYTISRCSADGSKKVVDLLTVSGYRDTLRRLLLKGTRLISFSGYDGVLVVSMKPNALLGGPKAWR
jgi:hypothetical protein